MNFFGVNNGKTEHCTHWKQYDVGRIMHFDPNNKPKRAELVRTEQPKACSEISNLLVIGFPSYTVAVWVSFAE